MKLLSSNSLNLIKKFTNWLFRNNLSLKYYSNSVSIL
jgi:hypothetical protein